MNESISKSMYVMMLTTALSCTGLSAGAEVLPEFAAAQVKAARAAKFEPANHRVEFPPRDGRIHDGWELAQVLCATMSAPEQGHCGAIVHRSRHFSIKAVLSCGKIRSDSEKLRCVEAIADHVVSDASAEACASQPADATDADRRIADCLKDLAEHNDPWKPDDRWGKLSLSDAARVCSEMRYDEDRTHCLNTIADSNYFDAYAVQTCARRWHDSEKTECLRSFKDRYLSPNAVAVCAGLGGTPNRHRTNDGTLLSCLLSGSSDKPFNWGPSEDPEGMQSAVRLCRSLRDGGRTDECMAAISSARFFSAGTVSVCRGMLSDGYKIQCLSAVKDSRMPSFVAETCMKEKYEPAKIECLSKMARGG